MHKNIPMRVIKKHEEHVTKNMGRVLDTISKDNTGLSVVEIFSILSECLSDTLIDSAVYQQAYAINNEINNNEKLSKLFNEVGSAHLNGIILVNIGLSLINLDKYADEVINESIAAKDFLPSDLDSLKKSNVNNIKKSTLDRLNHYLVTGESTISKKDNKVEKEQCTCKRCQANLNRNTLVEAVARELATLNKLNANKYREEEEVDWQLLYTMLENLIK